MPSGGCAQSPTACTRGRPARPGRRPTTTPRSTRQSGVARQPGLGADPAGDEQQVGRHDGAVGQPDGDQLAVRRDHLADAAADPDPDARSASAWAQHRRPAPGRAGPAISWGSSWTTVTATPLRGQAAGGLETEDPAAEDDRVPGVRRPRADRPGVVEVAQDVHVLRLGLLEPGERRDERRGRRWRGPRGRSGARGRRRARPRAPPGRRAAAATPRCTVHPVGQPRRGSGTAGEARPASTSVSRIRL